MRLGVIAALLAVVAPRAADACSLANDPLGPCDRGSCVPGALCVSGNCFGCLNGDCSGCDGGADPSDGGLADGGLADLAPGDLGSVDGAPDGGGSGGVGLGGHGPPCAFVQDPSGPCANGSCPGTQRCVGGNCFGCTDGTCACMGPLTAAPKSGGCDVGGVARGGGVAALCAALLVLVRRRRRIHF
jgi:hypothetical protein